MIDAVSRERRTAPTTAGAPLPEFPEAEVAPFLDNTWTDTARAIFDKWLGLVYQLTNSGPPPARSVDGIDPRRPLDSLTSHHDTHL